jgi:hypothetical protein
MIESHRFAVASTYHSSASKSVLGPGVRRFIVMDMLDITGCLCYLYMLLVIDQLFLLLIHLARQRNQDTDVISMAALSHTERI